MEMESSRRSMDRSRELGSLKKPKLGEFARRDVNIERDRPFPQKSSGSLGSRVRSNERERDEGRDDVARSDAYQPPQQEIVGQYKSALAELTFNSKPIITNLTIIAGENLHAAKAISATVCANILEVPSEQKLPSLYLLDSIVKNIGRDYIKFFAARLPEVFCKAYRQVDASIHPSMRHLFGTWKGVFSPSVLHIIEKELGFQQTINGSSYGASTMKPDSQAQRPPHSIHVNPKYLERQRLQQSSRPKEIGTDNSQTTFMLVEDVENVEKADRSLAIGSTRSWTETPPKMPSKEISSDDARSTFVLAEDVEKSDRSSGLGCTRPWTDMPSKMPPKETSTDDARSTFNLADDVEKPDRSSVIGSSRPWTDMPSKMPHSQMDKLHGLTHEKNRGSGKGDFEFFSGRPQHSDLSVGNSSGKAVERSGLGKPWYGADANSTKAPVGLRNGFDLRNSYSDYREQRSVQTVDHLTTQNFENRNSRETSGNWKNYEEEEYMWEDMNSRLTDKGADKSRRDGWRHDLGKPECLPRGKWTPLESEHLDARWNTSDSYSQAIESSRGEDRVPFQRGVEDSLPLRHGLEDVRPRCSRETSAESLRGLVKPPALGPRNAWPTKEPQPMGSFNQKSIATIAPCQLDDVPTLASFGLPTSMSSSRTSHQFEISAPSVSSVASSLPLTDVVSGSSASFSHQPQQPCVSSSPAVPSFGHQHPQSPLLLGSNQHLHSQAHTKSDHLHTSSSQTWQKPSQLAGQLNREPHFQANQDPSFVLPDIHVQPGMFRSLTSVSTQPTQRLQSSSPSSSPFTQLKSDPSLSQHLQTEVSLPQTHSQMLYPFQKSSQCSIPSGLPNARLYSEQDHAKNHVTCDEGQSNSSSILAAIMKSGLVKTDNLLNPSMPDSSTQLNFNSSGPPPMQVMNSVPMVSAATVLAPISHASASAVTTNALKAVLPPLPPGPPPPSSLVGASSQASITASATLNPLSTLLSSLVSKGLISTPQKEVSSVSAANVPFNASMPVSSSSPSTYISTSCSDKDQKFLELAKKGSSHSEQNALETRGLIGTEFKPEIIRELHLPVIESIFDYIPNQCSICGSHFKFQDQLYRHIEWHDSKKVEPGISDSVSRRWYAKLSDWFSGDVGLSLGPICGTSMEDTITIPETSGPLVSADESQCLCFMCGEPFEDFYNEDTDEWMYKGAVHMTIPAGEGNMGTKDRRIIQGPIVHANCMSKGPMNVAFE